MTARIIGTGRCLPDKVVTNDDLSKIVDTNDDWIQSRTGINNRRIVDDYNKGTVYMATEAAKNALMKSKVSPEEIDLIIVATMSADNTLPNTACDVQANLGAVNAACFDLNAACSGFVFALNTAYAYINSSLINKAIVIGAETVSRSIDWEDRGTCVLFGDGAGAVVLEKSNTGIIDIYMKADGSKGAALSCKNRNYSNLFVKDENELDYIKMNGQEVFRFSTKMVPESISTLLEKANVSKDEIKYFVLHQANERIILSAAKRLGVDLDKFPMNLQYYGNSSAATIPILLDEMNEKQMLNHGDKIVLSGFGGGLTWGNTLLEW